jgi:hypothetical protein
VFKPFALKDWTSPQLDVIGAGQQYVRMAGRGLPDYHETIFRVEVRDSAGRRRTGWLKFGTPLLGMPLKDEHWN